MGRRKTTEADLFDRCKQWLAANYPGYPVFEEVSYRGRIADLVVVRAHDTPWVIEGKQSISISLLEQADFWKTKAGYVSILSWFGKRSHGHRVNKFAQSILAGMGVGLILAARNGSLITEYLEPARQETRDDVCACLLDSCREEHRSGVYASAGSPSGGHWTPFKHTINLFVSELKKAGGPLPLGALVRMTEHHYSSNASAMGALKKLLLNNKIKQLRGEIINSVLCVNLADRSNV